MRRRHPEALGDLLRAFLREEGLESPLAEYRVVEAWPQVMGRAIERYTGRVEVRHGVLYVEIKSPALRADLMMSRRNLVSRLNQHVGAQVLTGIVFF